MSERSITYCVEELQEAWFKASDEFKKLYPKLPVPILTCTYRSPEEQDALYRRPWDHIDNDLDGLIDEKDEKVTNAKAGQSYHNYYPARAFDVAFKKPEGGLDWDTELFKKFAVIVKKQSPKIFWGGDFKMFKDMPHFEIHL
jgi:peptidoglycan L-alanyl-D-glutamate endopeptidase CwlK